MRIFINDYGQSTFCFDLMFLSFWKEFLFSNANEKNWTEVLQCSEPTDRVKMATSCIYMFTESPRISNCVSTPLIQFMALILGKLFCVVRSISRIRCHCKFFALPCYQNIISRRYIMLFDTIAFAFGYVNIQHSLVPAVQ